MQFYRIAIIKNGIQCSRQNQAEREREKESFLHAKQLINKS